MAGVTRIEINFNRLLGQCQSMAEDKEHRDWRLEKVMYVSVLGLSISVSYCIQQKLHELRENIRY